MSFFKTVSSDTDSTQTGMIWSGGSSMYPDRLFSVILLNLKKEIRCNHLRIYITTLIADSYGYHYQ